jgi:hypothetical protein
MEQLCSLLIFYRSAMLPVVGTLCEYNSLCMESHNNMRNNEFVGIFRMKKVRLLQVGHIPAEW